MTNGTPRSPGSPGEPRRKRAKPLEARVARIKRLAAQGEEFGWSSKEARLALAAGDDDITFCAIDPKDPGEELHYILTPGATEWEHHLGDSAGCEVFVSKLGMIFSVEKAIKALQRLRTHRGEQAS